MQAAITGLFTAGGVWAAIRTDIRWLTRITTEHSESIRRIHERLNEIQRGNHNGKS